MFFMNFLIMKMYGLILVQLIGIVSLNYCLVWYPNPFRLTIRCQWRSQDLILGGGKK